jgi:hypothetical protein
MPPRVSHVEPDYDSRFRCRYCGAPCRDGGVCDAHSEIHRLDYGTVESAVQLTVDDVLALEAVENEDS